jgi:hypothetical protein
MNQYATYGELIVMPVGSIVKQPTSLSFVEGASIWMMFVTVYGALVGEANVQAGQTLVIPAASSSIGLASIQVANMLGAVPIALTRTREKKQRLLDAGAAHVVVTDEKDLTAEILRLTGGKGASLVFEPVGGPNFAKLLKGLAPGGTILVYGALSEEITPLNLLDVLIKLATIKGYTIWSTSGFPEKLKTAVAFSPRVRRGQAEARYRSHLPVRRDRRGSPLHGSEWSVREDRRHPLKIGISRTRRQPKGRFDMTAYTRQTAPTQFVAAGFQPALDRHDGPLGRGSDRRPGPGPRRRGRYLSRATGDAGVVEQDQGADVVAFITALGLPKVDVLGFSIGALLHRKSYFRPPISSGASFWSAPARAVAKVWLPSRRGAGNLRCRL